MATELDTIVTELSEADKEERSDLLLDFARRLPQLPDHLAEKKDASHRVEECQAEVFLFVELDGDRVVIHGDVPIEAPTVRGFVSILVEGLTGSTPEDVLSVRADLIEQCGFPEILGMRRVWGLGWVLRRLKAEVTKALVARAGGPASDPFSTLT